MDYVTADAFVATDIARRAVLARPDHSQSKSIKMFAQIPGIWSFGFNMLSEVRKWRFI